MRARGFDPLRLNVAAFARDEGHLEGQWPLGTLPRLASSVESADSDAPVSWSAEGLPIAAPGQEATAALRLRGNVTLMLRCQRCLQPMPHSLVVDRRFRFAPTEDVAARLDAELEDDVLASDRDLDLRLLLEDELLLALPLVPRHEVCPQPLWPPGGEAADETAKPFAGLAALRKGREPG